MAGMDEWGTTMVDFVAVLTMDLEGVLPSFVMDGCWVLRGHCNLN